MVNRFINSNACKKERERERQQREEKWKYFIKRFVGRLRNRLKSIWFDVYWIGLYLHQVLSTRMSFTISIQFPVRMISFCCLLWFGFISLSINAYGCFDRYFAGRFRFPFYLFLYFFKSKGKVFDAFVQHILMRLHICYMWNETVNHTMGSVFIITILGSMKVTRETNDIVRVCVPF